LHFLWLTKKNPMIKKIQSREQKNPFYSFLMKNFNFYEVVEGNLLDAKESCIVHQCNCTTTRAAGLAAQLHEKFPWCDIYSKRNGYDLGHIGEALISGNGKDRRYVASLISQIYAGGPSDKTQFYVPHLDEVIADNNNTRVMLFQRALEDLASNGITTFAFPWGIGCGLAKGNWKTYEKILREWANKNKLVVRVYKRDS
jgi:O-acetyl-ADP-ribose deacetylase (regulator of RNase III)